MNQTIDNYKFIIPENHLSNPDDLESVRVTLPSGLSAVFMRIDRWTNKLSEDGKF